MSSGAGLASIWVSVDPMAARGAPAWRWLPFRTHEVAAADLRPGAVLADEHGELVRVAAVGHRLGQVVLYLALDDPAHPEPYRRIRLRPTDVVRIPRTQPQGATS